MRLSANYNRVSIVTSLVVLILTGAIYYLFIHSILTDKLDRDLVVEEDEIRQYIATYKKLPLPSMFLDQQIVYKEIRAGQKRREFAYTHYYNAKEKEQEPGRSLFSTMDFEGKTYLVTITKSTLESEGLLRIILLITLGVTLVLLAALLLINHFLLNRLWRPFYTILSGMKSFEIATGGQVKMEPTKIDEFNELNASVNAMAESVSNDYHELKSFTDNASHEMMTPLAVINSKLDSLLQAGSFSEEQGKLLADIYLATGKLSRLHHSLLLLAKIENKLIADVQLIDMSDMLNSKLRQFEELFERDGLVVKKVIGSGTLKMSRYLADILLNNLFSNAVRHNIPNGEIEVLLNEQQLCISNTGHNLHLQTKLFDRFSKSVESEGMGLGLAITKQICHLYGLGLVHRNDSGKHYFTVHFPRES
jgi:signal transduction histidine kinase